MEGAGVVTEKIDLTIIHDGGEYRGQFEDSDEIAVVRGIVMRALGFPSDVFYQYCLKFGENLLDEMKTLKELELPSGAVLFLNKKV